MKTTIALTLIVILTSNSVVAQTPHSTWLDFQDNANGDGLIFKTDFGFLTFCGYVTLENYNLGILVTGLNQNHDVLFEKPLISDTTNFGMYRAQSVIAAIDTGYYQMLFNSSDETDGVPLLVRYDTDGDTVWTKKYFLNDPWEYRDFVLTQAPDGNIHLAGTHNPEPLSGNSTWRQVIMELDQDGNYISSAEFGGYKSLWNYSILLTEEGLITAGVMCLNDDDITSYKFRDFIRKFDIGGNAQWFTKIQVPPAGAEAGVHSLLPLNNGNYLYASGRSEGTLSGNGETSNEYTQPIIGEINGLTGDTIYEYGFNSNARWQQMFSLETTMDGGYVGVGTHQFVSEGELSGWPIGFMLKLDHVMNEEWYRYYVPSVWEGMGRWNNLTSVVENENGTFTALGMIYTNTGGGLQNGFIQDTYIITVDSTGCLVAGCDVGISEFENFGDLLLYPNPTSSNLTIQLPTNDNWTVRLYNMNGQLISTEKINGNNRLDLNLQNFTSGLYTVQAMNDNGKVYTEAVVKE